MDLKKSVINVIPYPKNVSGTLEEIKLTAQLSADPTFATQAKIFSGYFTTVHQCDLEEGENGIIAIKDENLADNEYVLEVKDFKVYLKASNTYTISYAFATLLQLTTSSGGVLKVPTVLIEDNFDRDYRGLMVDLARKFHPFSCLHKYIDLCYLYKVKYLHLIDHQSYTFPSQFIKASDDRFYTKNQLKELDKYAEERSVIIIPELELPGHSAYLIENSDGKFGAAPHKYTICVGKEDILENSYKLIDEVSDVFSRSPYIHLGADEVGMDECEECEICKNSLKRNNLSSFSEAYSFYVGKITNYVLSIGKRPIVWEGFGKEGMHYIPKETIVSMFETAYQMPQDIIDAGYDILNTSWKPLYISATKSWLDVDIHAFSINEFKNWIPPSKGYKEGLTIDMTDKILGSQICCWERSYETEFDTVISIVPALSERVWTIEDEYGCLDYEKRKRALKTLLTRFFE